MLEIYKYFIIVVSFVVYNNEISSSRKKTSKNSANNELNAFVDKYSNNIISEFYNRVEGKSSSEGVINNIDKSKFTMDVTNKITTDKIVFAVNEDIKKLKDKFNELYVKINENYGHLFKYFKGLFASDEKKEIKNFSFVDSNSEEGGKKNTTDINSENGCEDSECNDYKINIISSKSKKKLTNVKSNTTVKKYFDEITDCINKMLDECNCILNDSKKNTAKHTILVAFIKNRIKECDLLQENNEKLKEISLNLSSKIDKFYRSIKNICKKEQDLHNKEDYEEHWKSIKKSNNLFKDIKGRIEKAEEIVKQVKSKIKGDEGIEEISNIVKECNGLFNDLRTISGGVKNEFSAKDGDLYMNVSKLCIDITREICELKEELAGIDTRWINKKMVKGDFNVNSKKIKKYEEKIKKICAFLKNKIIVKVEDNILNDIAIVENYISIIRNYILSEENPVDKYVEKLNTYNDNVKKCADEVTLKCKRGKSNKESISYINLFIMCLLNRAYEIYKEYVNYMMITKKLYVDYEKKLNELKSFCINETNKNLLSGSNEGNTFSNFNNFVKQCEELQAGGNTFSNFKNFVNQCEELQAEDTVIGNNLTCEAKINSLIIYHNNWLKHYEEFLNILFNTSGYIGNLEEGLISFVTRFEREKNGSIKYKLFNSEEKIDLLNKDEFIEMYCLYELYNKKVQLSEQESSVLKFLELRDECKEKLVKLFDSVNNGSTDVNIQNKIKELSDNIGVIEQSIKICKNNIKIFKGEFKQKLSESKHLFQMIKREIDNDENIINKIGNVASIEDLIKNDEDYKIIEEIVEKLYKSNLGKIELACYMKNFNYNYNEIKNFYFTVDQYASNLDTYMKDFETFQNCQSYNLGESIKNLNTVFSKLKDNFKEHFCNYKEKYNKFEKDLSDNEIIFKQCCDTYIKSELNDINEDKKKIEKEVIKLKQKFEEVFYLDYNVRSPIIGKNDNDFYELEKKFNGLFGDFEKINENFLYKFNKEIIKYFELVKNVNKIKIGGREERDEKVKEIDNIVYDELLKNKVNLFKTAIQYLLNEYRDKFKNKYDILVEEKIKEKLKKVTNPEQEEEIKRCKELINCIFKEIKGCYTNLIGIKEYLNTEIKKISRHCDDLKNRIESYETSVEKIKFLFNKLERCDSVIVKNENIEMKPNEINKGVVVNPIYAKDFGKGELKKIGKCKNDIKTLEGGKEELDGFLSEKFKNIESNYNTVTENDENAEIYFKNLMCFCCIDVKDTNNLKEYLSDLFKKDEFNLFTFFSEITDDDIIFITNNLIAPYKNIGYKCEFKKAEMNNCLYRFISGCDENFYEKVRKLRKLFKSNCKDNDINKQQILKSNGENNDTTNEILKCCDNYINLFDKLKEKVPDIIYCTDDDLFLEKVLDDLISDISKYNESKNLINNLIKEFKKTDNTFVFNNENGRNAELYYTEGFILKEYVNLIEISTNIMKKIKFIGNLFKLFKIPDDCSQKIKDGYYKKIEQLHEKIRTIFVEINGGVNFNDRKLNDLDAFINCLKKGGIKIDEKDEQIDLNKIPLEGKEKAIYFQFINDCILNNICTYFNKNVNNDKTVSEVFDRSLKRTIKELFKFLGNVKSWKSFSVLEKGVNFFGESYENCFNLFCEVKGMIEEMDPNNIEACINENCSHKNCKIHQLSFEMNKLIDSYRESKEYFNSVEERGKVWLLNLKFVRELVSMNLSYNKVFNNGELVNRGGKVYGKVYGCKYICQKLNELFECLELLNDEMNVIGIYKGEIQNKGKIQNKEKMQKVKDRTNCYKEKFNDVGRACRNLVDMYEGLPKNEDVKNDAKDDGAKILDIQAEALKKIKEIYLNYINTEFSDYFTKKNWEIFFLNNEKNNINFPFRGVSDKIKKFLDITNELKKLEDIKNVEDLNRVLNFTKQFKENLDEIGLCAAKKDDFKKWIERLEKNNFLEKDYIPGDIVHVKGCDDQRMHDLFLVYNDLKEIMGVYNTVVSDIIGKGINKPVESEMEFRKEIKLIKKNFILDKDEIKIEPIELHVNKNKKESEQKKFDVNNNPVNIPNVKKSDLILGGKNIEKNNDDKKSVVVNYVEEVCKESVSFSEILNNIESIIKAYKDEFYLLFEEYKKLSIGICYIWKISSLYRETTFKIDRIYNLLKDGINKINSVDPISEKGKFEKELFVALKSEFDVLKKECLDKIKGYINVKPIDSGKKVEVNKEGAEGSENFVPGDLKIYGVFDFTECIRKYAANVLKIIGDDIFSKLSKIKKDEEDKKDEEKGMSKIFEDFIDGITRKYIEDDVNKKEDHRKYEDYLQDPENLFIFEKFINKVKSDVNSIDEILRDYLPYFEGNARSGFKSVKTKCDTVINDVVKEIKDSKDKFVEDNVSLNDDELRNIFGEYIMRYDGKGLKDDIKNIDNMKNCIEGSEEDSEFLYGKIKLKYDEAYKKIKLNLESIEEKYKGDYSNTSIYRNLFLDRNLVKNRIDYYFKNGFISESISRIKGFLLLGICEYDIIEYLKVSSGVKNEENNVYEILNEYIRLNNCMVNKNGFRLIIGDDYNTNLSNKNLVENNISEKVVKVEEFYRKITGSPDQNYIKFYRIDINEYKKFVEAVLAKNNQNFIRQTEEAYKKVQPGYDNYRKENFNELKDKARFFYDTYEVQNKCGLSFDDFLNIFKQAFNLDLTTELPKKVDDYLNVNGIDVLGEEFFSNMASNIKRLQYEILIYYQNHRNNFWK